MSNKIIYKSSKIVSEYANETKLQSPEKTILTILKENNIGDMSMLDIGVGGGRTTIHFANLVKSYIGVDYSEEMIDICKLKFKDDLNNSSFHLANVCNMHTLKDNTFDLILFSFNGLDYISHEERLEALKEIHRVAKPNAYFCFSAHNLQAENKIFSLKEQFSWNPKRMLVNLYYWFYLRFKYNKNIDIKELKNKNFAIFNDGGHHFTLDTYYIKPKEQIQQLQENGFYKEVRIFSFYTGFEILDFKRLESLEDRWLYYLCRMN